MTIRVHPIGLFALLSANGVRILFSADVHDVPRDLFDAIEGHERYVMGDDGEWWTKTLADPDGTVHLYCKERPDGGNDQTPI